MDSLLHETLSSWTRHANRRQVLVAGADVLVVILAAALLGRGLALLCPGLGLGRVAGVLVGAGGIAWLGWRLWQARWTVGDVAARVDRIACHHDLLQTGLAVEAGTAVGDPALQAQALQAARHVLPACSALAPPPVPAPRAALAAGGALLVAHLGVGRLVGTGPSGDTVLAPPPDTVALSEPRGTAQDGEARSAGAAADALDARPGQTGAPGSSTAAAGGDRTVSGSAQRGVGVVGAEEAAADAGSRPDPLAAAVDIWVPGAGGGGEGGSMEDGGSRTGQERAGSAGLREGDRAAPETNEREQAAGGAAPEGTEASEAVEDLETVVGGGEEEDAPLEEEAGADSSMAPEATGEDTEETLTSRNQPSSGELGKGRDEEMEGESGAGSTGQGGANAASGSATAVAESPPPDWEVAAEWVQAQWREAPTGQLKAVSEGQTGRRSTVEFQEIASRYAALAEGDARPEEVPPSRRAYLTRYFDLLRDPASPPGEPDGDD